MKMKRFLMIYLAVLAIIARFLTGDFDSYL